MNYKVTKLDVPDNPEETSEEEYISDGNESVISSDEIEGEGECMEAEHASPMEEVHDGNVYEEDSVDNEEDISLGGPQQMVDRILSASKDNLKQLLVKKNLDCELDEGNLLITDPNPLDGFLSKGDLNTQLKALARDNTQILLNSIFQLPQEKVDDNLCVKLPKATTVLPREKRVPAPKAPTRWELFAREKGLQKRKKSQMIWDDATKQWRPRWGKDRINDNTKDWVIELKSGDDPYADHFQKRKEEKKERVAKNELHRLQNIARSMKGKKESVLAPKNDKSHLMRSLRDTMKATASMGKFQKNLPNEKAVSKVKMGKKRKFQSNFGSISNERKSTLDILDKIHSKEPVMNVKKAVSKVIQDEQNQSRVTNRERRKMGKGMKKGKKGKR